MSHVPIERITPNAVLSTLPPFPIVLVSTRSNILTIGQLEYFTFRPLRLGIAVAHARYSHGLLREEREFVVNVPDAGLLEAVRVCGSKSGRDTDKFSAAGLTRLDSQVVQAASIAECGAHIECRVEQELAFEERTWFIGPVVAARQREGHEGTSGLLCGRTEYAAVGEALGKR